jgi:hypothetical protein
MELEDWIALYAKAEFLLRVVRREVVKDEFGIPMVDENTKKYITISRYPHLDTIRLFGEPVPDIEQQKEVQKTSEPPTSSAYKVDPTSGRVVYTNDQVAKEEPVDTLSDGDGFSFDLP